ncbi:hypothetical protein AKJ16_DCAP06609 [Drosera capensis]
MYFRSSDDKRDFLSLFPPPGPTAQSPQPVIEQAAKPSRTDEGRGEEDLNHLIDRSIDRGEMEASKAAAAGCCRGEGEEKSGVKREAPSSKGKSCKGTLYYSSVLKSKGRNPRCVGLVPSYIVSESEVEASKQGRSLVDFRYACLGYSVFLDDKDAPVKAQKPQLPVCIGFEFLMDKRVQSSDQAPAYVHAKDGSSSDDRGPPQPRPRKPTHSVGDEFLARFTRNANVVASGVVRNLRRVGNHIKDSIDDILYRRPK